MESGLKIVPNGLERTLNLLAASLLPMQLEKQEPIERRGVSRLISCGDLLNDIAVLNFIGGDFAETLKNKDESNFDKINLNLLSEAKNDSVSSGTKKSGSFRVAFFILVFTN